jgi:hypothetical protein
MHPQTRNLLAFLADEATDSILEALRNGPRTEAELVDLAAGGQKTANRRLKEVREREFVDFEIAPATPGKRGPRPRIFRISEPDVFRFCDDADLFALALAEKRARQLQQHVGRR